MFKNIYFLISKLHNAWFPYQHDIFRTYTQGSRYAEILAMISKLVFRLVKNVQKLNSVLYTLTGENGRIKQAQDPGYI